MDSRSDEAMDAERLLIGDRGWPFRADDKCSKAKSVLERKLETLGPALCRGWCQVLLMLGRRTVVRGSSVRSCRTGGSIDRYIAYPSVLPLQHDAGLAQCRSPSC